VLREAGFENVNLDLMFAVPGQTVAQWRESLDKTVALAPEHISAYCLTYEEDTEFFDQLQQGRFAPDEDLDADLFEMTMDVLASAGYRHYEISNHCRAGHECLHNLAYWQGANYLGIGPSAFSTVGNRRWQNVPNAEAYSRRVLAGASPVCSEECLDEQTRRAEAAAFALRTDRGIPAPAVAHWREAVAEFSEIGLLREQEGRFVLTRRGKMLADTVAEAFV
jgi:oxygen-independent coproporphyrinogen-3 oxidase